jgi:hypothetical protein
MIIQNISKVIMMVFLFSMIVLNASFIMLITSWPYRNENILEITILNISKLPTNNDSPKAKKLKVMNAPTVLLNREAKYFRIKASLILYLMR